MIKYQTKYELKKQVTYFLRLAVSLVNKKISEHQNSLNALPQQSQDRISLLQKSTLLAAARGEIETVIQQYIRLDGLVGGTRKS